MVDVKEHLSYDIFRTPWGWIGVAFTPVGLRRLVLPQSDRDAATRDLGIPQGAFLTPRPALRRGISEFFAGTGPCPTPPVDLAGVTGFTRRVLEAARTVPPGTTISYGELARRAGSPRGCRAAGQVMARNPIPLVIPCHRVVGAGGLGGYAGGPAMKARLLDLESRSGPAQP